MPDEGTDQVRGGVEGREVAREAVAVVDRGERREQDVGHRVAVARLDGPQAEGRGVLGGRGGAVDDQHGTPGSGRRGVLERGGARRRRPSPG
jgi:hypothetical protein